MEKNLDAKRYICSRCHACACNECFSEKKCRFCGYDKREIFENPEKKK